MGVPISNVTRRVVFAPSGTGPYAFTFEILAATDIEVYKGDTLLTLTTDYTVTINPNGTGEVNLVLTAGTDNITIVGARAIERVTDFVTGGDFFANTVNTEFDSLTIFAQQNSEAVTRSIQAPVTDPTTIDMTLPTKTDRAGKYLSFNTTTGDPEVVNNVVDVTAVAANATNINTVAGQITPVNNISTVAGAAANIATVAGISGNVTTVAGISGNVTTVAGISANVTSVAGNATNINTVAGLSTEITALGPISADITTVAGIDSDVTAVAADATDIGTVAGNIANVNTVAGISSNVTTVAGISANVTTVAGISSNVTTVAGIAANVTTVAGISANVTTVAGISSDVTTVATNVSDITNFSDVYLGAKTSDPATRNDSSALQAGDLYFNTSADEMRVYTGSAWKAAGSAVNGTTARQTFTATAGQTTFTVTGGYDAGFADVYLNGVKLVNGTDVTVTSGTDVVLATGAAAGDSVDVIAYGAFVLANTYTQAQVDSFLAGKVSKSGDTMTGGLTLGGALNLGSTGQIQFPATQNASADANTLDDYEQGTFTPTAFGQTTAGTTTYVAQSGSYTKIGRQVTVSIRVEYSAMTGTGDIVIGTLPFASVGTYVGCLLVSNLNWTGGTSIVSYLSNTGTSIALYYISDDGAGGFQQCVNEAVDLYITMTYFTTD
jgi:hypothetical protein